MFVRISIVFVAACTLQLTHAAVAKTGSRIWGRYDNVNHQIVYPGPVQDLGTRYGTSNNTDRCAGLTYCTLKPDDYPQEQYNKMFKGKYKEPLFQPISVMADDRQGDPDLINNCDSVVTFEPLYKVRTEDGKWRNVVQAAKENFLQMVRLETCKEPGGACFTSFKAPRNLQATCRQTYNDWEFLVDDENGGTEKVKVSLPVCCSCHYNTKA